MLTAGKATSDDPSGMKSSYWAKKGHTELAEVKHEWSRRSSEIMQGLLEAYLHKSSLRHHEKECIERNVGTIASGFASAAEDSVASLKKGIKTDGQWDKVADMIPFLVDGAGKVMGMVRMGQRLMKDCVLGDTVQVLNVTAKHLANVTYLKKRLVVNGVVTDEQLAIDKHFDADKMSEELHLVVMETLRATEKFGLKCGASDEGCFDYGTELLDNFKKLIPMKKEVEGLVNEAGWLSGEAEMRLATPEQKETAKLRKDAAFRKAHEMWEFEKEVTAGVMIKAAACGTRPPLGPWGTPQDGCDLKPEDPIMKALLTDDPAEFIRRWRAEIAKTAGIEEEYVHVDISQCLGKHGRPTLPPNFFKK